MASTVTSTNNLSLRSILEKDKLIGSNFLDWERNLMIVLRHERKWYVLEEPLGEAPPANAPAAARNAHKKHSDDLLDVACLMLATMSPDLQAGLINTNAYDMIRQLRDMFQTQARTERYDATKAFNECKMVKGTSVSDHVMKMKRHLDHLERLGHPVPLQLATDTILNSLSEDYRPFVVNYNMNNMEKTIAELHSMLKTAELNMGNKNKTKDVLMVKDGGVKKKNGHASTSKGKGPVQAIQSAPKKGKGKGKGKKVKPNKARTENRCFICNEIGHWRQNCPKRHEAGRNHSSTQQLRKVAVLHIQELEVVMIRLLNNSYRCCKLKVAQIFDRVSNIGRDPRLRLLLGIKKIVVRFYPHSLPHDFIKCSPDQFGSGITEKPNSNKDRLGYDQPSKAVKWLLQVASTSIDKLSSLDPSFSSLILHNHRHRHQQVSEEKKSMENNTNFEDLTNQQQNINNNNNNGNNNVSKSPACSSTSETSKGSVVNNISENYSFTNVLTGGINGTAVHRPNPTANPESRTTPMDYFFSLSPQPPSSHLIKMPQFNLTAGDNHHHNRNHLQDHHHFSFLQNSFILAVTTMVGGGSSCDDDDHFPAVIKVWQGRRRV
ncbi:hypothetical protein OSB04_028198 [Centaurea solstitialis]|uniref:CCHC-type domain-containing protein n=1 Tax=Centaurea solstitialis TaxID=347529 RepID=A0AA38SYT2_9ASTR|nr:hypothetical protein OSB04_028198 [Centaurea solstitialis]